MSWTYRSRLYEKANEIVRSWEMKYGNIPEREKVVKEVMNAMDDSVVRLLVWLIGLLLAPGLIGIGLIIWYELRRKDKIREKIRRIEERVRGDYVM